MIELNKIYNGDSVQKLKEIESGAINLVVTSPPYFAYKDYGAMEGNIENFDCYEKYINYFEE